jgi:M-phase inducer tyrosine phosphatase
MTPGKGGARRKSDEYLPSPSRQVDESPAADRALRRMASGSLLARLAATAEDSRSSAAESSFDLIPAPQLAPAKRLRRPALGSTLAPPSLAPESGSNNTARHSAHGEHLGVAGGARPGMPPRRAFSAMGPPAGMSMFDESSSFENSMEMTPSDPAARKQARTLRRCDGAEELRQRPRAAAAPLVPAPTLLVSPAQRMNRNTISESPSARYMISNGLPGFGDNEAMGKVLPCHRVAEDGLMRIKPETLTKLLDGAFRNQIVDFRVIDCRFEYEYLEPST